jgi:hypothetical protein
MKRLLASLVMLLCCGLAVAQAPSVMTVVLDAPFTAIPGSTIIFDSGNAGTGWVLSNNNLTATKSDSNWNSVLTKNGLDSTGLHYYEASINVNSFGFTNGVGVTSSAQSVSNVIGNNNNGIAYYSDGTVRYNAGTLTSLATYTAGDIISVAVDFTNNKVWFRKNAAGWNNDILANQNPASNVGGYDISARANAAIEPAVSGDGTDAMTGQFSKSSWTQSVPSGYSAF